LFGEFTIADAMFAPVVSRFKTYDVKMPALIQAYADRIWSLPAMQEWVEASAEAPASCSV
jgi:glutathione S-transferase